MKKYVFLASTLSVLALASCKKDHSCECVIGNSGSQTSTQVITIEDASKSDARDACDALEITYTIGGATADCNLK